METVLLLTSCVTPSEENTRHFRNPEVRKQQYLEALKYYLTKTYNTIVICDNSGYDFSTHFQDDTIHGRLECLHYTEEYDAEKGLGFGERNIIAYALQHSAALQYDCNIVKITGRIIVDNLTTLLTTYNRTNPNETIFADISLRSKKAWSILFMAPKSFFMGPLLHRTNFIRISAGYSFESSLFDAIKDWKKQGHYFKQTATPFYYRGFCAGSNQNYPENKGLKSRLITWYKSIVAERKLA